MKKTTKKQEEIIYSCTFMYGAECIKVHVEFDNQPIRMINGVEKASGWLHFYKGDVFIDFTAFYEDFDNLKPLKPEIAKKNYIEMLNRIN